MFNFKDKISQVWDRAKVHPLGFVLVMVAMVLVGNVGYFSIAGKLGANVDHSTTVIHGGHSLVVPGDSLGGFMSGSDKTKLDGLGATMKGTLKAITTSNQATLTGLAQTVDSVALSVDGMAVGLFGQTTTTQDGCYLVHSGAWTRCAELAAGSTATDGYYIVGTGTANKGVWYLAGGVVGTNDLTATNIAGAGGGTDTFSPTQVRLMTTVALPAGTYNNGAGTYTVTANGACAAIDGVTPALNDRIANQNDTSTANGIYSITQLGSGGSQCVFTRDPAWDTAAEIQGSSFTVKDGALHGGATYRYPLASTHPLTLGTSTFFATRADIRNSPLEGFACTDELTMVVAPTVNVSWPGPCGFEPLSNTISVSLQASGSGIAGALAFLNANTAVAFGGLGSSTQSVVGSGYMFNLDTNIRSEFRVRHTVISLSNGTNRYSVNTGFTSAPVASQVVAANAMSFVYDDATSANWRGCCSTASTPVCADTGVVVGATTMNTFHAVHEAGAPNVFFDVNGSVPVSVAWSACPAGVLVEPGVISANSAGTSNANRGTVVDSFSFNVSNPLGR